jgi:cleavage and polyadenylation specificity factor subunit 3
LQPAEGTSHFLHLTPENAVLYAAGYASLPLLDDDELSDLNVALITHFHLDHCAAVPHLVASSPFKGKIFMTHATKSIFCTMMKDMLRMQKKDPSRQLFTAEQLEQTMSQISVINFHQTLDVDGIQITPYRCTSAP